MHASLPGNSCLQIVCKKKSCLTDSTDKIPTRNKTLIGSTVIWRKIFLMYGNMITELCIDAFFYDIEAFINEKIGKPPKDKQMIIENLFYWNRCLLFVGKSDVIDMTNDIWWMKIRLIVLICEYGQITLRNQFIKYIHTKSSL